ncbi:MAG: DNA repair protein RecN [Clostridiales bacterium]|nr:DNA repair protein RecN [Clostridiales bacterium]
MLLSLHIENIAVARSVDIDLGPGFTVLTGETGAGKSVIIGSIGLLMGRRPDRDMIRSGESRAMVSGLFGEIGEDAAAELAKLGISPDEDGRICLQRDIEAGEKFSSQARINGRAVPVSLMRDCAARLINIHGQHDTQTLLDEGAHISLLDGWAMPESGRTLEKYGGYYHEAAELKRGIAAITRDAREKSRRVETLKYQISEIDEARLKDGEEEKLRADEKKIRGLEKLQKHSARVWRALWGGEGAVSARDLLSDAADSLDELSEALPDAAKDAETLRSYVYELEDIAEKVRRACDIGDEDPGEALDRIENRLADILRLTKKYGPEIKDVLAFRDGAAKELEEIELSDVKLKELRSRQSDVMVKLKEAASELSALRESAAVTLGNRVMEELAFLDMDKVRFSATVSRSLSAEGVMQYGRLGRDTVIFEVATNPGEPLKPLSTTASGGELSRIMLALRSVFSGRDGIGTVIYDEVDTGVSGRTSQKIGIKLALSGRQSQVICVTHSAQIAALADSHLKIEKTEAGGRSETTVRPLDHEQRVAELSRIMGGIEITEAIRRGAREMLDSRDSILKEEENRSGG